MRFVRLQMFLVSLSNPLFRIASNNVPLAAHANGENILRDFLVKSNSMSEHLRRRKRVSRAHRNMMVKSSRPTKCDLMNDLVWLRIVSHLKCQRTTRVRIRLRMQCMNSLPSIAVLNDFEANRNFGRLKRLIWISICQLRWLTDDENNHNNNNHIPVAIDSRRIPNERK